MPQLRPADWTRRVVNIVFLATPVGLLLARAGHARIVPGPHGVWVAMDYRSRFPAPRAPAVTIGDVVLLRLDADRLARRPRLLIHESRHSAQWARWLGMLGFPIAYGVASLWSVLTVGNAAMNNTFERRAGFVDGGYLRPGEEAVRARSRKPARP